MTSSNVPAQRRVVLEVDGLQWATENKVVEAVLGRRPGVVAVAANPVAQTATVTFDPTRTTVGDLAGWIRECGYHCRGESLADHQCPSDVPTTRASRPPETPPSTERQPEVGVAVHRAGGREQLAAGGRTAVLAAVDGRAVAVIGIAEAVRPTSTAAVDELRGLEVEVANAHAYRPDVDVTTPGAPPRPPPVSCASQRRSDGAGGGGGGDR